MFYIAIQPDVFDTHVSSYVGRMMDVYIGYCTKTHPEMIPFSAEDPVIPPSDEDATSGN